MAENEQEQLKPCPFCGAEAFLWRTNWETIIECSKYHVDWHRILVAARNDVDAIKRWDQREVEA